MTSILLPVETGMAGLSSMNSELAEICAHAAPWAKANSVAPIQPARARRRIMSEFPLVVTDVNDRAHRPAWPAGLHGARIFRRLHVHVPARSWTLSSTSLRPP